MKMFNSRKGFSLTELMVVVLIMAILISVAIPVFLASRDRAIARAGQARLRNAATAAKLLFSDEDMAYDVQATDPELTNDLNIEAEPITIENTGGAPTAGSISVFITASTSTTMTLQTLDANDRVWQAVIAADGEVTVTEE